MARFTHADLTAAQKSASRQPNVRLRATDKIASIPRLRFTRLYTGSEEENYHAAVVTADGSLLRQRILTAGPATRFYMRVPNAGPGSDFATWTSLPTVALAGVALSGNASATVLRVHVASAGTNIRVDESTDNGQTFGTEVTAASLAGVKYLAVAQKTNGDAVIIYSDGTLLKAVRRTSGTWQTPIDSGFTLNSYTGVSIQYAGDFHIVITGTDSNDNPIVTGARFGDGGTLSVDTWQLNSDGPLGGDIAQASDGAAVTFGAPSFLYANNGWLSFVEKYSGSIAYDQPHYTWFPPSQPFQINAWREPQAFDQPAPFGLSFAAGDANFIWLTNNFGVWRAPYSAPKTDLSADVEAIDINWQPTTGQVRIELDNSDGRYNDLPNGAFSVLRPGAQLDIETGFDTASGVRYPAPGLLFWLDRLEHQVSGDKATLVLHASNVWGLLAAWRARQQLDWALGDFSVSSLLTYVFGRAGVELITAGTSTIATTLAPAFTINPGQDGVTAALRLLAMIPDLIYPTDNFVYLTEPKTGDASNYTFGTDHPILHARYADEGLASNRVLVVGTGHADTAFDFADIDGQQDKNRIVVDINLDAAGEVTDRATTELRRQQVSADLGDVTTLINTGQDLFDVATISDPHASPTEKDFRVQRVEQHYRRAGRRPLYQQRLTLRKV